MAFARDTYTASAAQTDFTISFAYIDENHVEVYEDGVLKTAGAGNDYTIVSSTIVRFTAGLVGGETIVITRATSQSTRLVDYATASTLTEEDLDNDSLQAFYMAQEAIDIANTALGLDTDDNWTAETKRIKNVTDPTADQDAATKKYGDDNWGGAAAAAAASSAGDAATSATNAATSETNAAASYDSFDDRYLGSKTSDPALDNDGDALLTGALYWNSTANEMRVYNGSSWSGVGIATFSVYTYVATAAQTVFTGVDANSNTMSFANSNRLVFLNGVFLREGASHDYQASGGNTITLNSGANLNDVLEVFTVDTVSVADAITQATGDSRYLQKTNNLSDLNSAATARTNLGLGAAALASQAGKVAQMVYSETVTAGSTTTSIPQDDTIPQNNEGAEVLTVAITPTDASSKLKIDFSIHLFGSTSMTGIVALFEDTTADAFHVAAIDPGASALAGVEVAGTVIVDASSTSARTYKMRVGSSAGTLHWLSDAGSGRYGSAGPRATLVVTEILP